MGSSGYRPLASETLGIVEPHQSEFINNNAGESYKLASGLHVAQLSEQNRAKGEAHTQ